MVIGCPKSAALMRPVKMVAIVEEYFFKIVSANLKKKEDSMPCMALLITIANVIVRKPVKRPVTVLPGINTDMKNAPHILKQAP